MSALITVMGTPVGQGSMRAFMAGDRPVITHTKGARLMAWRSWVAECAHHAWHPRAVLDGPVRVDCYFVVPRPKSVKRALPSVKPDLDKLVRAVWDALTGVVFQDDGQVVAGQAAQAYGSPPRLVIRVQSVTPEEIARLLPFEA